MPPNLLNRLSNIVSRIVADDEYDDGEHRWEDKSCPKERFRNNDRTSSQQ